MSDAKGPYQRSEWTESFTFTFSFLSFPLTMQHILDGTFPFAACTVANCALVTGQNTPTMDETTPILAPHVSYSNRVYTRPSNGGPLKLIQKIDGEADLSWEPAFLEIDLEPLSTADSRKYRLRVYPGCNNDLCAPSGMPRTTDQCLDPDTQTWYVCGNGQLLTVPLSDILNMIDNSQIDTITPPRIDPGSFETFITSGTTQQSWTCNASQNDTTDPNVSKVSNYSVSLTVAP